MKCFKCIVESGDRAVREAVTVYKGTALCAHHTLAVDMDEKREMVNLPKTPQRRSATA